MTGFSSREIESCASRFDLWSLILERIRPAAVLEIGVWKGDFARHLLSHHAFIERYYMIDPWRPLPDWNKPLNVSNADFEDAYRQALERTAFAKEKISVLRGTTLEKIDELPDEGVDFVYVDGDHTLRGITIDLINAYRKTKPGGFIGGDDLYPRFWQHGSRYEPTLVFPFAVYFAESIGAKFSALPFQQFLIEKPSSVGEFVMTDYVGNYDDRTLRRQLTPASLMRETIARAVPSRIRHIMKTFIPAKRL